MTTSAVLPSTITSLAWQENEAKLVRCDRLRTGYVLVAFGIGVIGALVAKVNGVAALCFVALSLILLACNLKVQRVIDAQSSEHIKQKVALEILLANQKLLEALEPVVQASPTLQTLSSVYALAPAGDTTVYGQGRSIILIASEIARRNLTDPPAIPDYDADALEREVGQLKAAYSLWNKESNKRPGDSMASTWVHIRLETMRLNGVDSKQVATDCHLFMWAFFQFQTVVEEKREELFPV